MPRSSSSSGSRVSSPSRSAMSSAAVVLERDDCGPGVVAEACEARVALAVCVVLAPVGHAEQTAGHSRVVGLFAEAGVGNDGPDPRSADEAGLAVAVRTTGPCRLDRVAEADQRQVELRLGAHERAVHPGRAALDDLQDAQGSVAVEGGQAVVVGEAQPAARTRPVGPVDLFGQRRQVQRADQRRLRLTLEGLEREVDLELGGLLAEFVGEFLRGVGAVLDDLPGHQGGDVRGSVDGEDTGVLHALVAEQLRDVSRRSAHGGVGCLPHPAWVVDVRRHGSSGGSGGGGGGSGRR